MHLLESFKVTNWFPHKKSSSLQIGSHTGCAAYKKLLGIRSAALSPTRFSRRWDLLQPLYWRELIHISLFSREHNFIRHDTFPSVMDIIESQTVCFVFPSQVVCFVLTDLVSLHLFDPHVLSWFMPCIK